MQQSLAELDESLQKLGSGLMAYQGLPVDVLRNLVNEYRIQAVFVNRDYTPFSRRRDNEIWEFCHETGIDFISCSDALLTEPEAMLKADGLPYKVFTAFHNRARFQNVGLPTAMEAANFVKADPADIDNIQLSLFEHAQNNAVSGGRKSGLTILANLDKQAEYEATRDFPALEATSKLSAHLKFGTLSIRETYHAIKSRLDAGHPLLRQLYWRDFFTHIAFHFPHVFGKPFNKQYEGLTWDNNRDFFQRWCDGLTGFPIVDAGMRELNTTGFMHNRVRMIVASFLTKDLHISWRWGERYFAQHLVDYDPAVNNGNWQWAASTGCDAQPYFRIFNPWLQQLKFDPECSYIKNWLPELRQVNVDVIQKWYDKYIEENCHYPAPMLDHSVESKIAKERYRQVISH